MSNPVGPPVDPFEPRPPAIEPAEAQFLISPFANLKPRPRFQQRYRWHVILFGLTLISTTWIGVVHYVLFAASAGRLPNQLSLADGILGGLTYSLPLLAFLSAHEFGHYWYCRRHNVDATWPYFLPAPPFVLTGTFGAVIRIREAFPSKRALFDIGVAGPIAGFVVLLPFLYWGLTHSAVVRFPETSEIIWFGEPLLLKLIVWFHFGALPEGFDIVLHPVGFAAWFGMLATAINLLPFGQLDGGHIIYSVLGRRAAYVSAATLIVAVIMTIISISWLVMTLMMLAMAWFLGLRHPPIVDEHVPLDTGRVWIAVLALVIFVLCFTPVPISILGT